MLRLFVAVCFPKEVRESLARLQTGVDGVNWIVAENLHLTLRFIGDVPTSDVEDIGCALAQIRFQPFDINFGELGWFGSHKKIRTLWVGIKRCSELEGLKRAVDQKLFWSGMERPIKSFVPHVSLGRVREKPRGLQEFFSWGMSISHKPVTVGEICLVSSVLRRNGPIYHPLMVHSLVDPE
tara:strand:- start:163 stop:705 length:543 start_codon:yes stop_codon:yes gene_type:complete